MDETDRAMGDTPFVYLASGSPRRRAILEELGIDSSDDVRIAKVRQSLNLLQDTHLIQSSGIAKWRWSFGKKLRKGKYIPGSRRMRELRKKRELREHIMRQA